MDEVFPILKVASYIELQRIKPETVVKQNQSPRGVLKKVVLKNLAKFTGKPLCQSLILVELQLGKRLCHRSFPVNIAKFLRTPFLQNTSGGCLCQNQNQVSEISKNLVPAIFYYTFDIMSSLYIVTKPRKPQYLQKNICGGVHSYCSSNFETFKLKYLI